MKKFLRSLALLLFINISVAAPSLTANSFPILSFATPSFAVTETASHTQKGVIIRDLEVKTGDILFQAFDRGEFASAIESVSYGWQGIKFSHVGVAYIVNDSVYILEAIPYGVSKTPIETFLRKSKDINGKPVVAVARLKRRFQKSIPDAISTILSLVGKRYDFVFDPNNDMYYCSELIEISFLHRDKPIFKSNPMSFTDMESGKTHPYWIKHFEIHKEEIPEGVLGTNPSDISKSNKIKIVHSFW